MTDVVAAPSRKLKLAHTLAGAALHATRKSGTDAQTKKKKAVAIEVAAVSKKAEPRKHAVVSARVRRVRQIVSAQRQHGTLHIRPGSFGRILRQLLEEEVANSGEPEKRVRIGKDAAAMLHAIVEAYVTTQLQRAAWITGNARRSTTTSEDIRTVLRINDGMRGRIYQHVFGDRETVVSSEPNMQTELDRARREAHELYGNFDDEEDKSSAASSSSDSE